MSVVDKVLHAAAPTVTFSSVLRHAPSSSLEFLLASAKRETQRKQGEKERGTERDGQPKRDIAVERATEL